MAAAAELLRFKGAPGIFEGLAAAAQGDPFWAVRRGAIDSLGKLGDPRVTAVLQKTCLDPHSSVRTAALAVLGDSKDRGLIEWYKKRFARDESDNVRAEALRALGKTGDSSVIPFLEKSASVPSYRDMVRTASAQALKQFGRF
jgi:HEAT repeat protein